MKRVLEAAVAGIGLIASAPLLGALAAAVRLDSPGPALFTQIRVGRNRRPFEVVKLRTMFVHGTGPLVTSAGDERITRVGRFLRTTKLDELPQLWNVLVGDMSFVGPRPEVPSYVQKYREPWLQLFAVRPGLTDLASLVFRDEEGLLRLASDRERAYEEVIMPLKLELSLDELRDDSLLHDFVVVLKTVAALVMRTGTRHPAVSEAVKRIEELER